MKIPNYITHYYLKCQQPFLNLSDLNEEELRLVVAELSKKRKNEKDFYRKYGDRYMELRRKTEKRLRELFILVGGKPEREAPHYFVLGNSYWFKHLCPDTQEIKLYIDDIPPEFVSFTYPDSFIAMEFAREYGLSYSPRPYHGKVFRIKELDAIATQYGLPKDDLSRQYENYAHEEFEKFIEVQVWSDKPISKYLT